MTGTLTTDQEASPIERVAENDSVTYALTPDGSESGYIGTAYFEKSFDQNNWSQVATLTGTVGTPQTSATTGTFIYLNFSGTAATVDGNGTLDVTATFTVVGCMIGDD